MNTRTNARTWKKNARYIVQVGKRGTKGKQYIRAELRAIAVDAMSEIIIVSELSKFLGDDKLVSISDASTAQQAISNAILFSGAERIKQ